MLHPNYNVVVSGNYSPEAISVDVSLNVNANPSVTIADGPTAFCAGDSVSFDVGLHSAYLWSNGSSAEIITVQTGGFYTVTVTNNSGCMSSAHRTATALIAPAPNILLSNLFNFCSGGSAILTVGASFASYVWNSGESTQSISCIGGTYFCTVTSSNGCTGVASQIISTYISPAITSNGATTFCFGGSVILDAGVGSTFQWNTNANTREITTGASGIYTVTVTDMNGCTGIASQLITVNPLPTPTITANSSTTFCPGGSVVLDAGAGYTVYTWSNPATTQTVSVSNSGNFSVTCTNANGCIGSSNPATHITIYPLPNLAITGNMNACTGGSTTLTASGSTTYSWSPSSGLNTTIGSTVTCHPPSLTPITYTIIGTNNCGATSTNINVTVGVPTFTYNYSNILCRNDSSGTITINATGGNSPYTYSVFNTLDNTLPIHSNNYYSKLVASRHRMQVTDAIGCVSVASYVILSQPSILTFGYTTTGINCNGNNNGSITLIANGGIAGTGSNPRYSYSDNANIGNPSWIAGTSTSSTYNYSSLNPGTYVVRVKDANGCTSIVQNVTVGCIGARIEGNGSSTTFTFDVYPNPTHDRAIIEFQNSDVNAHVLIEFFGIVGGKLSTLFDSDIQQGVNYQAEVNTESLPSGIYLYRILYGDKIICKKLIVQK